MSQGQSGSSPATAAEVATKHASRKDEGWWYPLIYVGVFIVIIIVNLIMVNYAATTFSGLAVHDPYMTGNHYNGEIEAAEAQKRLGWSSTLTVDVVDAPVGQTAPATNYPTRVSLTIKDRDGAPVEGLTVAAEIRRPAQQGMDQHAELVATDKGVYSQVVTLPAAGQWQVRLIAQREGQTYRLNQRALIQANPAP